MCVCVCVCVSRSQTFAITSVTNKPNSQTWNLGQEKFRTDDDLPNFTRLSSDDNEPHRKHRPQAKDTYCHVEVPGGIAAY